MASTPGIKLNLSRSEFFAITRATGLHNENENENFLIYITDELNHLSLQILLKHRTNSKNFFNKMFVTSAARVAPRIVSIDFASSADLFRGFSTDSTAAHQFQDFSLQRSLHNE